LIVVKVKKHSNQPKVKVPQPHPGTEITASGIRVSKDDISMCAYYIYQQRGSQHGYHMQDWVEAERLITER